MKKHVLITGGAGFIGSHLCDQLLARGYAVTALDNLVTGRMSNIAEAQKNDAFDFVKWDISQPVRDEQIPFIQDFGLHGVFHFACPASPVDFDRIPFEILKVDSLGTIHTVDLALKHGARYLVASTSEIYGDPLEHPQKETYWGNVNTIGPRACYDETKRFAEAYVSVAIRGVGKYEKMHYEPLNGAMVRIFNTYGPRMRPDDGRVVPELCMQAIQGQPLTIHGDGKQTRSFCYVSDLVAGIIALFESDLKQPMNCGNPVERTILEFAEAVRQIHAKTTGKPASAIRHLPGRTDDPKRRCPDISLAKEKLGWQPKVDLMEGLAETYRYFVQNPK
ncbi:MAG: GDP-mannose 4,6-dehydratase [Bacteriovoracia bacterium]